MVVATRRFAHKKARESQIMGTEYLKPAFRGLSEVYSHLPARTAAAFIIADTPKGSFRTVEVKERGGAVNFTNIDTAIEAAKAELLQYIESLEERLKSLENAIPKERVVILREVSMEEAEKEILELFSKGQILYYSDIAEQLGLDLRLVVEICNKLQAEGEIEVVDDTLQRR